MRIAVALGDPNGIGPEIAIKAAHHVSAYDPTGVIETLELLAGVR